MDKKLKTKWVKALRSGRYRQTKGKLKRGDANCCLGVLCRITRMKIDRSGDSVNGNQYDQIFELVGDEHLCRDLATMNDEGVSFAGIADAIEQRL